MNLFSIGPVMHAPLLLAQAAAQSTFERWVDVLADIATIVIALALIVAGLVALYGALKVWGMIRRTRTDAHPAIRSATAVADNARAMSDRLRTSVEELSATVSDTNVKVRRATEAAEAKLAELGALAGVVQAEAEEAFIRAASAVRGVQVGTEALRRLARRGADGEPYEGELDALLDDEGMDDEGMDDEGMDDEGMDDEDDVTEIRVTPPRPSILD